MNQLIKPEDYNVFVPLPWQLPALQDTSPVMLLTGSAGGGKSRVAYEKMVAYAWRYPGANVVALRKVLEDCKRSIIPTLEDHVIGRDMGKRVKKVSNSRVFMFSNGSRIWWGGMRSNRERRALRSMGSGGALDLVLMEEGTEFEEADFNEVLGRMRGKAAPWRQAMIATNPDGPLHWINRRLIIGGEASVHLSSVADNTHVPDSYRHQLGRLTGIEAARLARGLWVEGSGLVIDTWTNKFNTFSGQDHGGNVSLHADFIPENGRVVMFIDDGYVGEFDPKSRMFSKESHPRVILLAQIRPTGQIAVFYENYAIKTRYRSHLEDVLNECRANNWPLPSEVHYDKSAATLEAELKSVGLSALYRSTSQRDESIKFMKERIAADENGFRSILVHPRCQHLILEMSSWPLVNGQPAKWFDHGPDALRYGVWNIFRGAGGEGTVGIPDGDPEFSRMMDEKFREIDRLYDRIDAMNF